MMKENLPQEIIFQLMAITVMLLGVFTGYTLYYRNTLIIPKWKQSRAMMGLRDFLFKGWAFDQIYNAVLVRPFVFLTRINQSDVFDKIYNGIAFISQRLNQLFSVSQNGSIRRYIVGVIIGIFFILTLQLLL
jgi:NADH-quinone oxidoreductase subunit L